MKYYMNKKCLLIVLVYMSCILLVKAFDWDKLDAIEEIGQINFEEREFKYDAVVKRALGEDNSAPREITTTVKRDNHDLTLRFEKKYRVQQPTVIVSVQKGNGNQYSNTKHRCVWLYENVLYEAFVLVDLCHQDTKLHMQMAVYIAQCLHLTHILNCWKCHAQAQIIVYTTNVRAFLFWLSKAKSYLQIIEGLQHREIDKIGELFINGDKHVILPDKSSYRLFRCKDNRLFKGLGGEAGPLTNPHIRSKRQTRNFIIELMFYIDNSIYDFFYNNVNSSGLTTAQRAQRARDEIRTFYSFIATGMNYRYSVLSATAFSIQVKLVSIYIQEVPNSLSGVVDSPILLNAFSNYIGDQLTADPSFPTVDHYMLITRNDLQSQGSGSSAGLANQGTLCASDRKLAASIAEDRFSFINEVIFTHELGHGLDAEHDGSNNLCSGADKFIMAADNSLTNGMETLNLWRFSDCSRQSIENFVNILDNGNFNCMLTIDEPDLTEITSQGSPLGQVYSPDEQCRRIFTSESAMARSQYTNTTFEPICIGLWCANSGINTLALPAEGTSCASGKWCDNGVCMTSNEAPGLDANCAFGDQPSEFSGGQTCSEFVTGFLGHCYENVVRFACCQSCEARKLNISGCEYGDRLNCSTIPSTNCYDASIRANCCKTCNDFEVAGLPESCKYGDKNLDCTTAACSSSSNLDVCCQTCRTDGASPNETSTTSELPDWVIPVAAGAGGLVFIILIVVGVCCLGRSRASSHVRRVSRMEGGRSRPGRPRTDRRENRNEQPDRRRGAPDYRNGRPSNGRNPTSYTSSSGNPYSSRGYNMYSNGY